MSIKTESTSLNVSSLVQDTNKSTDSDSIFTEQQIVSWTEKEQELLDKHVKQLELSENNLKSILEIAMLFPNKTVQQLTMRVRWLGQKNDITWEQYCKQHQKMISPAQSPKHESNHTSPRKKTETKRRSCQLVHKRSMSDSKSKKRRSVPNVKVNPSISTSPDFSNTVFVKQIYQPQNHQQNQQFQTESIKSDPTDHSSKYINTPQQPVQYTQVPVQQQQQFYQQNYQNVQTTFPNVMDPFNNINTVINQNEDILSFMETAPELDINIINAFGYNLHYLLELTDELAKPSKLPFLSLMLSVPPSLQQQQQQQQQQQDPSGSIPGGFL
ncbi:Myb-like domain-containing protein [Entamoeba marina]